MSFTPQPTLLPDYNSYKLLAVALKLGGNGEPHKSIPRSNGLPVASRASTHTKPRSGA